MNEEMAKKCDHDWEIVDVSTPYSDFAHYELKCRECCAFAEVELDLNEQFLEQWAKDQVQESNIDYSDCLDDEESELDYAIEGEEEE